MPTTYVSLIAVKNLLRTKWRIRQGGTPLEFSESYSALKAYNGNVGSIELSRVDFDDSFAGNCRFRAIFGDDTTTANIYMAQGQNEMSQEASFEIGSGSRFSTITCTNPFTSEDILSIAAAYWVGGAVSGDYIEWRTSSLMSNDDAEAVINDAEFCIDQSILEHGLHNHSDRTSLMFGAANIPGPLVTATKYLAGYMIYSILFPTAKLNESEVFQWFRIADNLVTKYVKSIPKHGAGYGARKKILRPDSYKDKLGTPFLSGMDLNWRQDTSISIEDVLSRIRDYRRNPNYVGYTSQSSNFP